MTPKELIAKLTSYEGPCMRLCAYCPDDYNTAEVKKCVEGLIEEVYNVQKCNDDLLHELIKIRIAYKEATGVEYSDT